MKNLETSTVLSDDISSDMPCDMVQCRLGSLLARKREAVNSKGISRSRAGEEANNGKN